MDPGNCPGSAAAPLLRDHLDELRRASARGPILDLACGTGRNGLYLVQSGIPVVFADRAPAALETVAEALAGARYAGIRELAQSWQVDFEQDGEQPLPKNSYGGIIVFRYLHRPLLTRIRSAVRPGGLVIYETFTVEQAQFGRPRNPDFLLRHGELEETFSDWRVLHRFEGIVEPEDGGSPRAIAQIVASKPA